MTSDFRACSVLFRAMYENGHIRLSEFASELGVSMKEVADWLWVRTQFGDLVLDGEGVETIFQHRFDADGVDVLLYNTTVSSHVSISSLHCSYNISSEEIRDIVDTVSTVERSNNNINIDLNKKGVIKGECEGEKKRDSLKSTKRRTRKSKNDHFEIAQRFSEKIRLEFGEYAASLWDRWAKRRYEKKWMLTEFAADTQYKRLQILGRDDAIPALEDAVSNEYRGIVFPNQIKNRKAAPNGNTSSNYVVL